MKDICLAHLVRSQNGLEPLERFLESYRLHPGGVDHDLLIVFKGFGPTDSKAEYLRRLASFQYSVFEVSDKGYDITAYFAVAKRYASNYRYFCFLNSFSVIQDHDWLSKLHRHISQPGVGLVGATGSWQSLNPWGRIMQRRRMRFNIHSIKGGEMPSLWERINIAVLVMWHRFSFPIFFSPFPNYHLRTNAFLIHSELINRLVLPTIRNKIAAYKFESGKTGLTSQVIDTGNTVLIIGRDGNSYDMKSWDKSRTFWQDNQENLLVADNQTRSYQNGTAEQRRYLTYMAWGLQEAKNLENIT